MKKFFIAAGIILAALAAVAALIALEALILWALIKPATSGAISFSPWQAIWIMVLINLLALKFKGRRGERGYNGPAGTDGPACTPGRPDCGTASTTIHIGEYHQQASTTPDDVARSLHRQAVRDKFGDETPGKIRGV